MIQWLPLLLSVSLCTFCSCATPYQHIRKSPAGGYDDNYLGDDTYLITIRLNAFTDKATAYEYFHRRAKEIADQKGYERYDVLELLDPDEHGILYWGKQIQPIRYPRLQGRVKYYRKQVSLPPKAAPSLKDSVTTSRGTAWPVKEGFVVTNNHVVAHNDHTRLFHRDGSKILATVVLRDEINDLVLLKVQDIKQLPPALPLSSAPAKMGAAVFTIGYPFSSIMGTSPKLTEGTINAVTGLDDNPRTLQISVPIQPGNSGGPLLNMNGEVVGIVVYTLNPLYTLEKYEALPARCQH